MPVSTVPVTTPITTPVTPTPTPTPPAPAPANVSVAFSSPIASLTAGGTRTIAVTASNTGGTAQPAGDVTLNAGPGVTLLSAEVLPAGFRRGFTALAAAAAPAGACVGNTCPLPELAAGANVQISLLVSVAPTAARTDLIIDVYDQQAALTDIPVNSGYSAVTVVGDGGIAAGSSNNLVLTATPAAGVLDPGPLTIPRVLSHDLLVATAPAGCVAQASGTAWDCAPAPDGSVGPAPITATALPGAQGDQDLALTDAAGRPLGSDTPVTVTPLTPGDAISLTGPFNGTVVGADTLYCAIPGQTRSACGPNNQQMVPRTPAPSRAVATGGGAVIWAELTWATAGPTGDDTVTLSVDGSPVNLRGVRAPVEAGTSGQMTSYRSDVTSLITDGATVSVADLEAATQPIANSSPFAAWTLAVIWQNPDLPDSTVSYRNSGTRSIGVVGKSASTRTVAANVSNLRQLFVTLWSPDPWGAKSLTVGGSEVSVDLVGSRRDDHSAASVQVGFDLIAALPVNLQATSGPVVLRNGADGKSRVDNLWIGPTLTVEGTA